MSLPVCDLLYMCVTLILSHDLVFIVTLEVGWNVTQLVRLIVTLYPLIPLPVSEIVTL